MNSATAVGKGQRSWPSRAAVPVAALLLALAVGALATLAPFVAFLTLLGTLTILALLAVWEVPAVSFTVLLAGVVLQPFAFRVLAAKAGLSPSLLTVLALWKEALIVALLGYVSLLALSRGIPAGFRLRRSDVFMVAFAGLGLLYVLLSKTPVAAVYALRNYLEPLAIYLLIRLLPLKIHRIRQILWILVILAVLNALFAFAQATVLGLRFYATWGFLTPEGTLPTAFRIGGSTRARGAGTFTGPNELAAYLVVMIALVYFFLDKLQGASRRLAQVVLATLVVGLAFTFSRSLLLGLGVGLLVPVTWQRLRRGVSPSWVLLLGAVILLALGVVWQAGLGEHLARTVTLEDSSARGHLDSWADSVALMFEAPFGVGLGLVGARAGRFGAIEQRYHSESTYFQIGMELGWLGLGLYLAFLLMLVLEMWAVSRKEPEIARLFGKAALATLVGTGVAFLFLPLAQSLAGASGLWLLVGLAQRSPVSLDGASR